MNHYVLTVFSTVFLVRIHALLPDQCVFNSSLASHDLLSATCLLSHDFCCLLLCLLVFLGSLFCKHYEA